MPHAASLLGLRYLGILLVSSLVTIPAATAKRRARSLRDMLLVSEAVSIASRHPAERISAAVGLAPPLIPPNRSHSLASAPNSI